MMATAARVRELKNVYAAGQSATIGAMNPHNGHCARGDLVRRLPAHAERDDGEVAGHAGAPQSLSSARAR
jgi:hypothetical protein